MKRESVKVLEECIELQEKKSRDYQNPNSSIKQSMHYRRGVDTIHDMMHQKMLRAQSLIESGETPNNESLEDTYKDLINYASFAVSYLRYGMEGQDFLNDVFNKPLTPKTMKTEEEVDKNYNDKRYLVSNEQIKNLKAALDEIEKHASPTSIGYYDERNALKCQIGEIAAEIAYYDDNRKWPC